MIGLDTNVLARLFVDDDLDQASAARSLVTERCSPEQPGFVNLVTLCELVWVLTGVYGYDRAAIALLLGELLRADSLELQDKDVVARALDVFRSGSTEFADALTAEINRQQGCDTTVTFDRRASRLAGFERLATRRRP